MASDLGYYSSERSATIPKHHNYNPLSQKTGTIDLPLHPGKCPPWLFVRMKYLAREISRIIIDQYGTKEFLKRLSNPMFFQALGCALAFDWHSSGLTTTTCGAIKEALATKEKEYGLSVCGGKGRASINTLIEIRDSTAQFGLDTKEFVKASRLTAKVDSSCIQDGYSLYHHCFFLDEEGNWTVIQQGLNNENSYARRYHWFNAQKFVEEPPEEISGNRESNVLNMVSKKSEKTREISLDLVRDNPFKLRKYFDGQTTLTDNFNSKSDVPGSPTYNKFYLPSRHEIRECDMRKKDWEILQAAYELQPQNFEELISLSGMGAKKIRALALLSKLIFGIELDYADPIKYSFAHGGKDGIPYPVDRESYANSITFLQEVLSESKSNSTDKEKALRFLASIN